MNINGINNKKVLVKVGNFMKIVLDLKYSINNYEYQDKKDLEGYIKIMLKQLDELYFNLEQQENIEDDYLNRFYDILDMFSKYEVKEGE